MTPLRRAPGGRKPTAWAAAVALGVAAHASVACGTSDGAADRATEAAAIGSDSGAGLPGTRAVEPGIEAGGEPAGGRSSLIGWNVVREEVEVPMRDGVRLTATLLRPDAPGRFPTLVYRTPYGREAYADGAELPLRAAKRGYLVLLVDVRGRYGSGGDFRAYHQERDDGYDTIEWAAAHPSSDGRVGTWGGSYPGYVQWLAAAEAPPHLAAVAPDMTPVGSHHFFYQGGAFSLTWYEWFLPLILPDLRRRAGDRSGPWTYEEAAAAWAEEREEWYRHRPLADVPLLRPYAPYYYEWLGHPRDDAFWDFADVEKDFSRMETPALLLSGWYDDAYGPEGAVRGFRGLRERAATAAAREGTRLVLGPWTHTGLDVHAVSSGALDFGPSAGLDWDGELLRWFDRWLKGEVAGPGREPPVRYFVMGEDRWRAAADWPPAAVETRPLYLRAAAGPGDTGPDGRGGSGRRGGLDFAPPDDEPPDRYLYDPADPGWHPGFGQAGAVDLSVLDGRTDQLVYTSAPLERPLTVAGEVVAELWVSSDAPDTDFAFSLEDVHPGGASYNVASHEAGLLRMRYREGFDRSVLMEPGEVYRVRIGGMHTALRFDAGHRIRVRISSSRFPLLDANPNTGTEIATETRTVPARQTVHHDRERPSRILLPVLPRGAAAAGAGEPAAAITHGRPE